MINLEGKTALITGGSSGIGRACVDVFLEAGIDEIFVLDICEIDPSIKKVNLNQKVTFIRCDVSNEQDVVIAIQSVWESVTIINILVNCVGVHPPERHISTYSATEFNRTLNLNLTSAFLMCHYLESLLSRAENASVINISSMVGILGQGAAVDYCASKGGLNGLTRALAIDWASKGIRVNSICPSNVDTPAMQKWANSFKNPEEALKLAASVQKPPRLLEAREIANVCIFLASELSSAITGQNIEVDGGASLGY